MAVLAPGLAPGLASRVAGEEISMSGIAGKIAKGIWQLPGRIGSRLCNPFGGLQDSTAKGCLTVLYHATVGFPAQLYLAYKTNKMGESDKCLSRLRNLSLGSGISTMVAGAAVGLAVKVSAMAGPVILGISAGALTATGIGAAVVFGVAAIVLSIAVHRYIQQLKVDQDERP